MLETCTSPPTDRAQLARALGESEARYRHLVEHAPIAVYEEDLSAVGAWMDDLRRKGVTDLRAYLAEYSDEVTRAIGLIRVRDVNREAVEQAGATGKADLLANLPRLFIEQASAGFVGQLVALWDGRSEFEYESRARQLDGRTRDLLVRLHLPERDGGPDLSRAIVTATDITARRRAEDARAEEHDLLRAVLNAMPDLVGRLDGAGVYRGCNAAFAEFFGLRQDEVAGRTPRDFYPPDAADAIAAVHARLMAGGPPERLEVRVPDLHGRPVLFESLRVSLPGADGRPGGLIAINRDITARRRVEDDLRRAGMLEAVGRLAGGVAHEFNNLLTTVLGNLSLAEAQLPADHAARPLLTAGDRAAWRAAELARELLGFARRRNVKLEPADLNVAVAESLAGLRSTLDPRIAVDLRMDPRLSPALADVGEIGQVVRQLCLNARDAMPAGGTLTLETADAEINGAHAQRVPDARPGLFVRLTVADTGGGIPADVRDRIFEPFFTTKELGHGTGLGLALVHGIVAQHGGWVEVDSTAGRGTRFDLYLPRAASRRSEPERRRGESHATLPGAQVQTEVARTVLLVDDEPMIRTLGRTILHNLGYKVLVAADGEEAVAVYRRELGHIDLVVLDLMMPRMDGREACRELMRIDPRVRLILSSGFTSDPVDEAAEPGVRGFVAKPYRPSDLAAAVKAALAEK